MKKSFVIVYVFISISALAGRVFDTPFCKLMMSEKNVILKDFAIDQPQSANYLHELQILSLYEHLQGQKPSSLASAMQIFQAHSLHVLIFFNDSNGAAYTRVQGDIGDTEVSAFFLLEGHVPLAFTGDDDCYQDIDDNSQI